MTIRVVYGPQGREEWRGEAKDDDDALCGCWFDGKHALVDFMRAAGYTVVKEAPRMVEVELGDLELISQGLHSSGPPDYLNAVSNLRAIVNRERGR